MENLQPEGVRRRMEFPCMYPGERKIFLGAQHLSDDEKYSRTRYRQRAWNRSSHGIFMTADQIFVGLFSEGEPWSFSSF